ncbi:hypothetical protein [Pectobacterium parmentieri]|uniref:Uncharacterized protein n=1 Tax=Pectobacterium parmentieri TaxID=1905730 RepID=A0A8B3F9A1_PECPM|nr:hypothetical protein [Pectobacterium parmentieri]AOR58813.1 hypothetical protein A8F97_07810 [Pectobacterium parmentieri]AYH10152.1 hypothetical protein C5E24_10900 [Pectobacterium parmentieri]AYH19137.1 hypothetical protein C5E22_11890 [Pectobacterium parmentieri]AYH36471.1 hypothetical protein C5E17_10845 [Pectobacterium parmentieri]AZS56577.1 hypothetical protein C5E18_10845 [Pectobacterium parmentieri]
MGMVKCAAALSMLLFSFTATASSLDEQSINKFWESYQLKIIVEMNNKILPKDYGPFISLKTVVEPQYRVISKFYIFRSSFSELFDSYRDMKNTLRDGLKVEYCSSDNKSILYDNKGTINLVAMDKDGEIHSLFFSKEICE